MSLDPKGYFGYVQNYLGVSLKAGYWRSTAACRSSYRRLFGFHY